MTDIDWGATLVSRRGFPQPPTLGEGLTASGRSQVRVPVRNAPQEVEAVLARRALQQVAGDRLGDVGVETGNDPNRPDAQTTSTWAAAPAAKSSKNSGGGVRGAAAEAAVWSFIVRRPGWSPVRSRVLAMPGILEVRDSGVDGLRSPSTAEVSPPFRPLVVLMFLRNRRLVRGAPRGKRFRAKAGLYSLDGGACRAILRARACGQIRCPGRGALDDATAECARRSRRARPPTSVRVGTPKG